MDWNLGIFAIMSIITAIILVITGTRFIYIDPKYKDMIKQNEIEAVKIESVKIESVKIEAVKIEENKIHEKICYLEIGRYQSRREDNRQFGFKVDIFSLMSIIILGCLATLGIFESDLSILIILLLSFLTFPIIHFWQHLSLVNKMKSI